MMNYEKKGFFFDSAFGTIQVNIDIVVIRKYFE